MYFRPMSERLARLQTQYIRADLQKKMVWVAGPRQCGKTTIAELLLEEIGGHYYNWDFAADRRALQQTELDQKAKLWVFDELHKYRRWRNWLKGVYDVHKAKHRVLVTGSARLDIYSRSGDSLQGRYFKHRLHPITWSELCGLRAPASLDQALSFALSRRVKGHDSEWSALDRFGGFPEPLLGGSDVDAKRWRLAHGELLVREDVRSLETIRDLDRVELLYDRLPQTVGSVLSINSLREDLEVAFETVRHWLSVLENIYAVFRVPPFGAPKIKAVKKEQKLYMWDWSRVPNDGARFENLVALHLLRFVHWAEDVLGEKLELRYFRDTVGHEVDFILLRNNKPWLAVECKQSERGIDPNLAYLCQRVHIPFAVQLSSRNATHIALPSIGKTEVHALAAKDFLSGLP
jgi:predicted AAA+ superfamily ATPase